MKMNKDNADQIQVNERSFCKDYVLIGGGGKYLNAPSQSQWACNNKKLCLAGEYEISHQKKKRLL